MAAFTFFYKLRVDIQKFSSGSTLLDKWHQEAQAAMQAINAGAVQVWKDTADTVVYAILTVEAESPAEAHANVLNIFGTLPMAVNGEIIIEEARSVMPYSQWAEYLAGRGN